MTNIQAINLLKGLWQSLDDYCELNDEGKAAFCMAIEALSRSEIPNNSDLISRRAAIDACTKAKVGAFPYDAGVNNSIKALKALPSAQPEPEKYEYHYDHTDCIWYRPETRNRCPVTCAQYRDGWNDAMNYIYRDGKGYRPYRRDKQYGE